MSGLNLKTESQLYKKKLEDIVSEINFQNERIMLKQILFAAQDLILYHIDLIEDLEIEIEENSVNNSIQKIEIQRKRAKILLQPFQGLDNIEKLLKEAREKSAKNPTPNLVSEPRTQS